MAIVGLAVEHGHVSNSESGPTLSVGDRVEVEVEGAGSGGAGVGRLPDGRAVFVHRTAPGERVVIEITALKRSWGRGRLVEVLRPSPARREAPCPHYERCGGCTLEHVVYREQLAWKAGTVVDALTRIGGLEGVVAPAVTPSVHEFRYRSRVTLHLRRLSGGRVVAGFHQLDRPGRIVDIDEGCLLPEGEVADVWGGIRAHWGPAAERLPGGKSLRLTVRGVDQGAILLVEPDPDGPGGVPSGGSIPDRWREGAEDVLGRVPGLVAVWWRRTPSSKTRLLGGTEAVTETRDGRRIPIGPTAFLQVNREAASALRAAVLTGVARVEPGSGGSVAGARVVDGYCGVGEYGRALAAAGASVVGIEVDPEAARLAALDAPRDFEVVEGTVDDHLASALPADLVLVNPPRAGLHDSVTATLRDRGSPVLVYVSCDPATLARDIGRLEGVYELEALEAFDLFPQTAHVETVATLRRSPEG